MRSNRLLHKEQKLHRNTGLNEACHWGLEYMSFKKILPVLKILSDLWIQYVIYKKSWLYYSLYFAVFEFFFARVG